MQVNVMFFHIFSLFKMYIKGLVVLESIHDSFIIRLQLDVFQNYIFQFSSHIPSYFCPFQDKFVELMVLKNTRDSLFHHSTAIGYFPKLCFSILFKSLIFFVDFENKLQEAVLKISPLDLTFEQFDAIFDRKICDLRRMKFTNKFLADE